MLDIYFEPNYGKLHEKIENGESKVFEFNSSFGTVSHMFIKRQIPYKIDNKIYYDIITPYGYGGPYIKNLKSGNKERLIREFIFAFQEYCERNNIITEFVRFHPILNNALDFIDCYDVNYIRDTVGTNLSLYDNPFESEFSKSCRKDIRRALRKGVTYRIIEHPNDMSVFKKIYYSTLQRNIADDFYYFDDNYFQQCIKLFRKNIILVEAIYNKQVIAMGLYFIYKNMIHAHLSGTLREYISLSPAYILKYAITLWGKENGYDLIHHGGGRTNSADDKLYIFKKQFGKNTSFKFYIGKKIWNDEIYKKLYEFVRVKPNIEFFPAYRYKHSNRRGMNVK